MKNPAMDQEIQMLLAAALDLDLSRKRHIHHRTGRDADVECIARKAIADATKTLMDARAVLPPVNP